jgi:hypothetical protein
MTEQVINAIARVWSTAFGVVCVVAGVHPETKLGRRRRGGQIPVTRAQRVVLFVFGCLFVLYGVMGWLTRQPTLYLEGQQSPVTSSHEAAPLSRARSCDPLLGAVRSLGAGPRDVQREIVNAPSILRHGPFRRLVPGSGIGVDRASGGAEGQNHQCRDAI